MPRQTYSDVVQQIEKLQARAEELKRAEANGVIARIREAVEVYGLTPDDIFGNTGGTKRGRKPGKASGAAKKRGGAKVNRAAGAQYADGNGNIWGGRGPRPRWLREALASGASLESFLAGGAASSPPAAEEESASQPAPTRAKRASTRGKKGPAAKKAAGKSAAKRPGRRARAAQPDTSDTAQKSDASGAVDA